MGITDDNPQIKVIRVDLVDLGNSNTKFSRTYIYDEDGTFLSFSDMDINGNAYTATTNVEKEGAGTTNLNLGDLETVTTLTDNLDGTATYTNEDNVAVTISLGDPSSLTSQDIDTLAELNSIITDATLIDTTDPRLSDARTPLTHTHVEAEITDLDKYTQAEVDALITVFGTEAEDFIDTTAVNIISNTKTLAKTFITTIKPTGRYRVAVNMQIEGGTVADSYLIDLRVSGAQVGLEMVEEAKDTLPDNRNMRTIVGYYDHVNNGGVFGNDLFIQIFAGVEQGTLTIHGAQVEIWRVS